MEQLGLHSNDLREILHYGLSLKSVKKIQIRLEFDAWHFN
jgi:hypothetical protein